jgi:hypothetical protein
MTAAQFQAFYPLWQEFARYKDPAHFRRASGNA